MLLSSAIQNEDCKEKKNHSTSLDLLIPTVYELSMIKELQDRHGTYCSLLLCLVCLCFVYLECCCLIIISQKCFSFLNQEWSVFFPILNGRPKVCWFLVIYTSFIFSRFKVKLLELLMLVFWMETQWCIVLTRQYL